MIILPEERTGLPVAFSEYAVRKKLLLIQFKQTMRRLEFERFVRKVLKVKE